MSDFKPTKEQLQIFDKLKEVTEPHYVHSDQMIAIAMWIDAEFEHKSKANEANKQPDTEALRLQNVMPCTSFEAIAKDLKDGSTSVWTDGLSLNSDNEQHCHYTLKDGQKYKVLLYKA